MGFLGPSYWGRAAGALFECLELLSSVTSGTINIYDQPLIREMAAYIYRVHIADRYFVNFADAPGSIRLTADLVYRFGQKVEDKHLQLTETYELSHPAEELTLSLITPCEITTTNEHIYLKTTSIDETRTSGTIQIKYAPTLLTPSIEEIPLKDPKLQSAWGQRLFRILFQIKQPPLKDTWSFEFST